mgnify:CR=1 FL=1
MLKIVKFSFLILVICEVSARYFFGLGTPPIFILDDKVEYYFAPDQEVIRFGRNVRYNSFGMRNGREAYPTDKIILVAGDSVVNGGVLIDQSELSTTLLEQLLNRKTEYNYFVGNISAGSWGPKNVLEYMNKFGFMDAELFIYVVSTHDLYDHPTFEKQSKYDLPQSSHYFALEEVLFKYVKRMAVKIFKPTEHSTDNREGFAKNDTISDIHNLIQRAPNACVIVHPEVNQLGSHIKSEFEDFLALIQFGDDVKVIDGRKFAEEPMYRDDIHLNVHGQKYLLNAFLECLSSY